MPLVMYQPPKAPPLENAHTMIKMTTMTKAMAVLRFFRRCSGVICGPYLTTGGVTKVWNGAGEGTVHSRPVAPSQGLAGAGAPWPLQALTASHRKISCEKPNQNAPMVAISLKLVNWAE